VLKVDLNVVILFVLRIENVDVDTQPSIYKLEYVNT